MMNLKLTNKEFLALMKAVYLADCLANSHAETAADEHREISAIRRKIFAQASESGFGDLVRHDLQRDDFFETDEMAEEMELEFIEEHVERVFWRELRLRLADKIMDGKFGAEMNGWSNDTYRKRRAAIEAKVQAELETHGLNNLFLLGSF